MDRINNFAFKIATANGTGSASANGLIMQAIFRMGVPVTGKNVFPSNIQGLPTWYEIRVSREGYTARTPVLTDLKPGGRLFIVDFKRPTGAFAHVAIPMLVHHGMAQGMEGLPPVVAAAGFADVESGDMPSRSLGFVSARAPT